MRKLLLSFTLVFVLLLSFTIPVGRVHAAETTSSPCYGQGCNGIDPFTGPYSQCGNSVTSIISADITNGSQVIGTLTNYYSKFCNANWAEGVLNARHTGLTIFIITVVQSGGFEDEMCYPDPCIRNGDPYYYGTAFPVWTNMVNGTYVAEATADAKGGYYANANQ